MNITGINPLWITGLSFLITIQTGIATKNVSLDHVFPTTWIPWVIGWCGFLAFVGGALVTALSTLQSAKPGLFIKAPEVAAKAAVVLLVASAALFLGGGGAHAKGLFQIGQPIGKSATKSAVTPKVQLSVADAVQNMINDLQTKDAQVVSNVISALKEADADAGTVVTPASDSTPAVVKDPISHACYPAEIQYLQSLPTAKAIQAPAPYNLIVLFQYKRDLINMVLAGQLIPNYLKLGCSALLGNEAAIFAATLGMVGVGAATIAPITAFAGTLGAGAIAFPLLVLPK